MRDRETLRVPWSRGPGRAFRFLRMAVLAVGLIVAVPAGVLAEEDSEEAGESTTESPGDDERDDSEYSESTSENSEGDDESAPNRERNFEWEDEEELFDVEDPADEAREDSGSSDKKARRRPDVRLDDMSKSEARRAGFEFGDEARASRRTSSVLLAATAGTVAHGVGHLYNEDGRTAAFLAGAEGISAGLMGAGLTTWFLEGDSAAGAAVASKTFHLGAGLFGLSYLLDVVGTVRAGNVQSLDRKSDLRGIDIEAEYRYLQARGYPLNHHFRGGVNFDLGSVFGRASTEQEFALDGSSYGAELGVRWLRGNRAWTFAYAKSEVDFLDFRATGGFDRWRGDLRLGVSLDLGIVSPHLESVAVGAEAGYGRSWYTFDVPSSVNEAGLQTGFVPIEVYSRFDLSDRVLARVSYEQAPGRRLDAVRGLGGVGKMDFVYDSTEFFDLEIGAEFGGGFALSGGFLIHVW